MTSEPEAAPKPDLAVVERLFAAMTARDIDAIRDCFAPDVQVWHNYDNAVQTREENLQTLSAVTALWTNIRYENIRRHAARSTRSPRKHRRSVCRRRYRQNRVGQACVWI